MAKSKNLELIEEVEIRSPPTILLYGEIDDEMIAQASAVLIDEQYEEIKAEKIKILINSPGGDLHAAFSFIELMEASLIPIETFAAGQCVSAGLFIFMTGTKGMRTVTPSCSAMSHTYSTDFGGSHWDLKDVIKELTYTQERIIAHYLKHTGIDKKIIMRNLIGKGDHWLRPTDLVTYGLADQVGPINFN